MEDLTTLSSDKHSPEHFQINMRQWDYYMMMQKLKNDALWCKSAKNLAICFIYEASINLWCDLTTLAKCILVLNPEGVPAPHLNQPPPPDKCSINGTNKLKFCVWSHMGCLWEIPVPKWYNRVSGSRLSPRSKNQMTDYIVITFSMWASHRYVQELADILVSFWSFRDAVTCFNFKSQYNFLFNSGEGQCIRWHVGGKPWGSV